jgi:hypothetical protein
MIIGDTMRGRPGNVLRAYILPSGFHLAALNEICPAGGDTGGAR